MLTLDELRLYDKWLYKNPVDIRQAVLKAGGWAKVFPMELDLEKFSSTRKVGPKKPFPDWASRVRNFFNVTPSYLKLLPGGEGLRRTLRIKDRKKLPGLHVFALSGDVYEDESQRTWFEMSTGGTPYHYPGPVDGPKIVDAILSNQAMIPVFKLISPDDTGGSMEVCVLNPPIHLVTTPFGKLMVGESTIGKVGVLSPIRHRMEMRERYRGSYNYAETVIRGLAEHEYMDIDPHKDEDGYYVNPDPYSSLDSRRFRPL